MYNRFSDMNRLQADVARDTRPVNQPVFKDFITTTGFSGFRQVDENGNFHGMGLATKQCVLHFYPNAQFIE